MHTFPAVILPPLRVAVRDTCPTFVGSTSGGAEEEDTYSLDEETLEDCCIALDVLDGAGLVLIILEGVGVSEVDMIMEVLLEIIVVLIDGGDVEVGTGREVEFISLREK